MCNVLNGWRQTTMLGLLINSVVVLGGLFVVVYWYLTRNHGVFRKLDIPGPKPSVLGHLQYYAREGQAQGDLKLQKQYGRVYGVFVGPTPQLVVSDVDMVKQICVKSFSNFSKRKTVVDVGKLMRNGVAFADPDHWKFLRSTLSPTFSSGKMRDMDPFIQRCCSYLMDNIKRQNATNRAVEWKSIYSAFTMDVISSTAFGLDIDSQQEEDNEFVKNIQKTVKTDFKDPVLALAVIFPFLWSLFKIKVFSQPLMDFFDNVLTKTIEARKTEAHPRKDFLQLMLMARKEKTSADSDLFDPSRVKFDTDAYGDRGLNKEEIVANSIIFFLAGFDTGSVTLTWVSFCLAKYPECQDKVLEEIDRVIGKDRPTLEKIQNLTYLDCVFNETLRLYPPAQSIHREAAEEIVINGVVIPKGMQVQVPIYSVHTDPEYWPDPHRFDPDRFLPENKSRNHSYAWLPFGAGPRNCLGMRFAHIQNRIAMVTILQKYRFVMAPETEECPVMESTMIMNKPKNGIWLRVEER